MLESLARINQLMIYSLVCALSSFDGRLSGEQSIRFADKLASCLLTLHRTFV